MDTRTDSSVPQKAGANLKSQGRKGENHREGSKQILCGMPGKRDVMAFFSLTAGPKNGKMKDPRKG